MADAEFLSENLYNTTTMVKVDAVNTATVAYLFDKNRALGFTTVGYTGATATVISVEFATPTVVSHVLLQRHNLKGWRLFYNSTTANSLHTTSTNSQSSTYLAFASVTVSSIQLQLDSTIAGTGERTVGELVVAEREVAFERNPNHGDFRSLLRRKQVVHEMPDGGTVLFNIKDKYRAELHWDFISTSFHNTLLALYEAAVPLYFLPFPTATSWDGRAYEVSWLGDFDFRPGTNDKTQGYSGSIALAETPSG